MSSNQTRLLAVVVLSLVVAGGAMAALVFMQPTVNTDPEPFLEIIGTDGAAINVTLSEMMEMETISGNSSYQNTFGNIRGEGVYTGVRVSDLLDLVDGMTDDYLLRIEASDGYSQTFQYSKVNPNSTIYEYQGDMIIAYGFNELIVPEYEDGFRLAFIPEDGYYSNTDANASTDPNPSAAGPQWVSNVIHMSLLLDLFNSTLNVSEEFLRELPAVSGFGGYMKKDGVTIIGPYNFTGVPFNILLQEFATIPENYIIKSLSGDGYTSEYTKDVVEGKVNGYTPTGVPVEEINSTMILAYAQDGAPIDSEDGGSLRIVFINEDGNLTDGFRWAKDVVSISVFEVLSEPETARFQQISIDLIAIQTKYHY